MPGTNIGMISEIGGKIGSMSNPLTELNPWVAIVVVAIAFITALVVFAMLVEKKKAPRARFLRWLREYLNFRSILIAGIIKFVYLFLAIITTLMGIVVMFMGRDEMVLPMIGIGFVVIVFGNIFLRLIMEMMMVTIGLWENTSDIRAVLVKDEEAPEEKRPKEEKESKKAEVEEEVTIAEVEEDK